MADFALGFEITGRILLRFSGGVTAVVLLLIAVLVSALLMGIAFDRVTGIMAKRWEKTGCQPRGKLGRIILENHKRLRE